MISEFNINKIYHQYIKRVVIFAVFLYKNKIRNKEEYEKLVFEFVKKRIFWEINLKVDLDQRLPEKEERKLILDNLLRNIENDYPIKVEISFRSPLKETILLINLHEEEKYEKFIYG